MTRTKTTQRLTQTIAIAAASAALLAGCGSNTDDTDQYPSVVTSTQVQVEGSVAPSAGPNPSPAKPDSCAKLPEPFTDVDACDEKAVALTALRTMYSTNPTRDASSQDAMLRAVPLLSSAMIGRIVAPTKRPEHRMGQLEGLTQTSRCHRYDPDREPVDLLPNQQEGGARWSRQ
ncbi:hypothetical protein [Gordonia sp. SMJS1]|uniref:hypothetical protein n=1 Tax=Gordonia sp. SMJS1 TaxID=3039400 RepID=UPI0024548753|nr:hypothetical protein [Gordonia sp. SMJS1]WGJ88250.1 hypothetical protein QAD21_25035 [Gordonia sp. SMJS1]